MVKEWVLLRRCSGNIRSDTRYIGRCTFKGVLGGANDGGGPCRNV